MKGHYQNTIGRYFAEEWQQALANTGAFYVKPAMPEMSLAELNAIAAVLANHIEYWTNQVYSNTNATAVANAQAIADLYQGKLNQVNTYISQKEPATNGGGTTTTKNNSLLWILIAAAAALFLLMKKKGKQAA